MDLTFFKYEETPKWFHFKEDELVTTSISIPSPVSGLVVGFRYDLVAYHSKYAMGRTSLVYGNEHKTWPIILMPKHQDIQEDSTRQSYHRIRQTIMKDWKQLRFSHAEQGYIRFNQTIYSEKYIDEIITPKALTFEIQTKDYEDEKKEYFLDEKVRSIRAQNELLKEKLNHLN